MKVIVDLLIMTKRYSKSMLRKTKSKKNNNNLEKINLQTNSIKIKIKITSYNNLKPSC